MTTVDLVTFAARNAAIRRRAVKEAEDFIRAHIWALEEAAVNTLYRIYEQAYREMARELVEVWQQYVSGETWSATDIYFRRRTEALLAQLEAEAERLMQAAFDESLRAAVMGWQADYYGGAWQLEQAWRAGEALDLPFLPVEAIRAQILAPYAGSTFLDRFENARDEFERLIRKALVESQIRGESIYQAQVRLAKALGIDIGRLTKAAREANQGFFAKTELIARTEILRASNLGALEIYEQNADILDGWEWTATLDERTCPICGALDGQVFRFTSPQSPPPTGSHPRCRCTPTPVLKNQVLEQKIVGKRETYREWAERRGVTIAQDGGTLYFRAAPAPVSPSAAAKAAAGLY